MNIVFNISEALQLAALGPTLFLMGYLLVVARNTRLVAIAGMYLASLSCHFLLPIFMAFPDSESSIWARGLITFMQHLLPAFSFLIMSQFVLGKIPPRHYWLIMLLPATFGLYLVRASVLGPEICIADSCVISRQALQLYHVLGSSFVLLLMYVLYIHPPLKQNDKERVHKYWLIIMIIVFNIGTSLVELLHLAELLDNDELGFINTMVGISFVYLITTSIFRVFNENLGISKQGESLTAYDKDIALKIKRMIEEEKLHCDLGVNRAYVAGRVGLTEQHLSRIINIYFGKSFTDLMNEHRIREAKHMLTTTSQTVTAIAFDVGFNSIASFNRVFKEATGMTPTAYRRDADK